MTRLALDGRMLRHDRAGIGRYIWRLQEALATQLRHGIDIELLADRRGGLPSRPSLPMRPAFAPVRGRLERFLLPRALRGIDLVHYPDHGIPHGVEVPAVVTVHDISFLTHPGTHAEASRRHYEGAIRSWRRARAVIVLSEHVRAAILERDLVDEACLTVIPNAPGLSATNDAGNGRVWSGPFALMVGTIQPRKNVELAAGAFAASRFAQQGMLLVAGALGYRGAEIVRAVRTERRNDAVRFLGRVSDEMLIRLLTQAEFVLMPSLDEGFGLPAVEAMACGTPVIAARVGTVPEVVGEDALLLEPNDVEGWTAAIDQLIDDEGLRASLGARGRARAAQFNWERTARDTLAVYEAHA
ncbi:MAG: glycosyltransferase family 1 protein [Chloroflexota bacterium]|nr:glycosyltransferase family 1 protein [Chloroflexota bacterium]MDE2918575.1 glycosyltransferase family 1 protein [Chloroflexota bacterium]